MVNKETWIDRLPWNDLDPGVVDEDQLLTVKAAALVEFNAHDYARYLNQVFDEDEEFKEASLEWAEEEVLHGVALGTWAQKVDPSWDFDAAVKRFNDGYSLPQDVDASVRGSRAGELVARCIVEVGTSSFYTAFGQLVKEPVLKRICQQVAADEFRHYKLFYTYLKRYLVKDKISRARRLLIAAGRIHETEDDELAYAFYAANMDTSMPYDRRLCTRAYMVRAYRVYRRQHIERALAMSFKAAGLKPQGPHTTYASRLAYWLIRTRQKRMEKAVASEPMQVAA